MPALRFVGKDTNSESPDLNLYLAITSTCWPSGSSGSKAQVVCAPLYSSFQVPRDVVDQVHVLSFIVGVVELAEFESVGRGSSVEARNNYQHH